MTGWLLSGFLVLMVTGIPVAIAMAGASLIYFYVSGSSPPMVVELGIALDVLVGMLILGVFFFQIREQFDSLDLRHLEKLREGE